MWHQKWRKQAWNGAETHQKALGSKPQDFRNEVGGFRKSLQAGDEGIPSFGGKTTIFAIFVYPACPAPSKHLLGVFPHQVLHFGYVLGLPVAPRWSEMSQMRCGGKYHQITCFVLFSVRTSGAQLPEVMGHWGDDA